MRKFWVCLGLGLAFVGNVPSASAMAGRHGKGDPKRPTGHSHWSAGLKDLANRPERIGGHWINSSDWFEYAGKAQDLNNFLEAYGKLDAGSRTLLLVSNRGDAAKLLRGPAGDGHDWELQIDAWKQPGATVKFPVGGVIGLREVVVPANVDVEVIGDTTAEIATFLKVHQAKQRREGYEKSRKQIERLTTNRHE